MGEDGRGSLDPGVASGLEFVVCYPNKFLEFYYAENRSELPGASDPAADVDADSCADESEDAHMDKKMKINIEKAPVMRFMKYENTQYCKGGVKSGERNNMFT